MILGNFWSDRDPEVEALEVASWLRVLGSMGADEILDGWNTYQANGPKSEKGRLLKPTAHDIRQRVLAARKPAYGFKSGAKSFIDRPEPEAPRPTVDPVVAERICQEAGFTPEHTARLRKFPSVRTREQVETAAERNPEYFRTMPNPDDLHRARMASAISRAALEDGQRLTDTPPILPERDSTDPLSNNSDLDGEDPVGLSEGARFDMADQDQEPGGSPSQTTANGGGR